MPLPPTALGRNRPTKLDLPDWPSLCSFSIVLSHPCLFYRLLPNLCRLPSTGRMKKGQHWSPTLYVFNASPAAPAMLIRTPRCQRPPPHRFNRICPCGMGSIAIRGPTCAHVSSVCNPPLPLHRYGTMTECWVFDPAERTTFKVLRNGSGASPPVRLVHQRAGSLAPAGSQRHVVTLALPLPQGLFGIVPCVHPTALTFLCCRNTTLLDPGRNSSCRSETTTAASRPGRARRAPARSHPPQPTRTACRRRRR